MDRIWRWCTTTDGVHVQYMSDLHLDRIQYDYQITRSAPVLVLGGDIGRFNDGEPFFRFLQAQCQRFDQVFLVLGNHEFYGGTREGTLRIAQDWTENVAMENKLVVLNQTRHDFPDSKVTLLGCTLHSRIPKDAKKLSRDFDKIEYWKPSDHNEQHDMDLAWLSRSVEDVSRGDPQRRIVIVTHYAPSYEDTCRPSQYRNDISHCYCSTALDQVTHSRGANLISYWMFGHTHWNAYVRKMNVTMLSNQMQTGINSLTWWQKMTLYRPFNPNMTLVL